MEFDRSVLDRLINLTDPVADYLTVAEEYMKIDQYSAAFTYYMKAAEATDPETDFNVRYHCLCSISYIYWKLGNRWRGAIQYARLAKAECPDRPEAYHLLSLILAYFLYNEGEYEQGRWSEVYENAKIGCLFEKANPQDHKRYYHGIKPLLLRYSESLMRINRIDEAKEILLSEDFSDMTDFYDVEIRDFLFKELGVEAPKPQIFDFNEFLNSTTRKTFFEIHTGSQVFNVEKLEQANWKGLAVSDNPLETNEYNLDHTSKCFYYENLDVDFERVIGDPKEIKSIGLLILPNIDYLKDHASLLSYPFERIYVIESTEKVIIGYNKLTDNCFSK